MQQKGHAPKKTISFDGLRLRRRPWAAHFIRLLRQVQDGLRRLFHFQPAQCLAGAVPGFTGRKDECELVGEATVAEYKATELYTRRPQARRMDAGGGKWTNMVEKRRK